MSLVESTVDSLEISEDWPDLAVLERFETAWRAGDRLSIEATLAEVEPSRVPGLLMLLVSEEFQLRVEDGESPSPFAYLDRFPEYPGAIRAAFEGRAAATPWAGRSIARDRRASPGPTDPGSTDPVAAQPGHDQNGKDQGHLPKDGCRYQIREHHASGGLGDLYLADDQELPRKVVLKEIQTRHLGDPKARERFLIEARVTSQLEHPGIVPVHGLGSSMGTASGGPSSDFTMGRTIDRHPSTN
jgi:hypothetical protein